MKILISLVLIFIFGNLTLFGQYDKEFWFAAPAIVPQYSTTLNKPVYLRLETKDKQAEVKITQPSNPVFIPITVTIPKESLYSLDLSNYVEEIECKPYNTVLNKGIHIESTEEIFVFYDIVSSPGDPETYSLKGSYGLGKYFITPGQNIYSNHSDYSPTPYDRFYIVASEDNTTVTIIPSQNILGHIAKQSFDVKLNKGQVYVASATNQYAQNHLRGSEVKSDKPVAITICDDLISNAYCQNQVGDQVLPVSNWGTEYAVVKGDLNSGDFIILTGSVDNTEIYLDDSKAPIKINNNEFKKIDLQTSEMYIKSDKPINAMHYTGVTCEVGVSTLLPTTCGGGINNFQYSFVKTQYDNNSGILLITVPKGHENDFQLNNNQVNIKFTPFKGHPELMSGKYYVTNYSYNSNFKLSNTSSNFTIGFLQGKTMGGSYSYFSDFGSNNSNSVNKFEVIVPNTTVKYNDVEIKIPIFINSDKRALPFELNNINLDLSLDRDLIKIESIDNGIFTQNDVGSKTYISINIPQLLLKEENQEVLTLYCKLLNNDTNQHIVSIDKIKFKEENCLHPKLINGSISKICGPTSFVLDQFDELRFKDIKFVGNSYIGSDYIRLTSAKVNQAGAFWQMNKKPVSAGFITNFSFRMTDGSNSNCHDNSLQGADGIAFVIQNNYYGIIGENGGGIGYEGISNSLAVEYDTFNNDSTQIENYYDPNGNHVAVQSNKDKIISSKHKSPDMLAIESNIVPLRSDGTIYYSRIEYNAINKQFKVYLDTNQNFKNPIIDLKDFNLKEQIKLENDTLAWIGFTSATGCAFEIHDILYWDFCSFYPNNITGIEEVKSVNSDQIDVLFENNSIKINYNSNSNLIKSISIFNLFGQEIINDASAANAANTLNNLIIPTPNLTSGVYIIRFEFNNNEYIFKKINYLK